MDTVCLAELAQRLTLPLAVGQRHLPSRLVLAPMTFLGHVAFRQYLDELGGCGLMFSEMCSAKTMPTENRHLSPYFRWRNEEAGRLAFQIFGNDPAVMAEAARRIESENLFGVDINFGCAVGAICNRNCGAAVLKTPDTAVAIVAAVRRAVRVPVSVKFRTGWKDDPKAAAELARRFEDAGADLLTFHPRIAPDRRTRPPKWAYIGRVKQAVSIPVLGNGNVFSAADCLAMLDQTGCDGVALGRLAVARPWVFAQWTGKGRFDAAIYRQTALTLLELMQTHYDPPQALRRYKRFISFFAANFRFGHHLYSPICNAVDLKAVRAAVATFFDRPPDVLAVGPNQNFFN